MNDMIRHNLTPKYPIYIELSNKDCFYLFLCGFVLFGDCVRLFFKDFKDIMFEIKECLKQGIKEFFIN